MVVVIGLYEVFHGFGVTSEVGKRLTTVSENGGIVTA